MARTYLFAAVALMSIASSAWAYRVLEQTEDAYELSLSAVRLPANERSTVVFTECPTCRTTALRVTDATRYFVNRAPVELEELKEIADELRETVSGRENTDVYIYYDLASLRVNRLAISYRN